MRMEKHQWLQHYNKARQGGTTDTSEDQAANRSQLLTWLSTLLLLIIEKGQNKILIVIRHLIITFSRVLKSTWGM